MQLHTHAHTHTHIYMYIYLYINILTQMTYVSLYTLTDHMLKHI